MIAESESRQGTEAENSVQTRRSTGSLSRTISGWTSNLIASGIVIMVMLVVGRSLVTMWVGGASGTDFQLDGSVQASVTEAWPVFESAQLEFGDSSLRMERYQIVEPKTDATTFLISKFKTKFESPVTSQQKATDNELQLLAALEKETPIASSPGNWRIFQRSSNDEQFPMVFGIRDNGPGSSTSRLALIGIVLPTESNCIAYIFHPHSESVSNEYQIPLPPSSKMTLAISSPGQSRIVGFEGSDIDMAKSFYLQWTTDNGWNCISNWKHSGALVNATFVHRVTSHELHINLSLDSEKNLRGLMVVSPNQTSDL